MAPFEVRDRRIIAAAIATHLRFDAFSELNSRKRLRPNPVAPWELRIGRFRIFYTLTMEDTVMVVSVGHKVHSKLFIGDREVDL